VGPNFGGPVAGPRAVRITPAASQYSPAGPGDKSAPTSVRGGYGDSDSREGAISLQLPPPPERDETVSWLDDRKDDQEDREREVYACSLSRGRRSDSEREREASCEEEKMTII